MNIWQEIFRGIENEKQAFCGPHTVQIDLTDRCNNTCIACWVHSPLLDKKEVFPEREKEISFPFVEQLICQLRVLGTKEIILSGSGEPFMYPQIKEAISLIKKSGIYLNIITNGTLLNKDMVRFIVDKGVDLITLSMWAGTPQAYVNTHPGRSLRDFEEIKEKLKNLNCYKQQSGLLLPHVKVYNVLCNRNHDDVEAMVDFAKDIDAGFVEFQIVDVIKGKTDNLLLNNELQKKIIAQFDKISKRHDFVKWHDLNVKLKGKDTMQDLRDFGKLWKNYRSDFVLLKKAQNIICSKEKFCEKIEQKNILLPPGHFQHLGFRFSFNEEVCKICAHFSRCFPSQECIVDANLLNVLGIGTLMRRFSSPKSELGLYERHVDYFPCYIGWYYARILTNGDVIPCCKAHLHPLGNIYRKSFSDIWGSNAYRKFRVKAKRAPKTDPYFSLINCIKSCDNWGMNVEISNRTKTFLHDRTITSKMKSERQIIVLAKDYIDSNFNPSYHDFGKGLVIDGGHKVGFAKYRFSIDEDGEYEFWSRYASNAIRPVDIYMDGILLKKGGLNKITDGWTSKFLKWYEEFTIELKKGEHLFGIRSSNSIPHIEKFILFKKDNPPAFIKKDKHKFFYKKLSQYITGKKRLESSLVKAVKNRYIESLGIYDGEYGYKGPFHVQIDLTNNCNNTCIACWCNSPLLKEKRLSPREKEQYLPMGLVKELLDETSAKGATEVYYSGSGEPFMHPDIMQILEYSKKKNLICHVNTNFSLLTKEKLRCLIDIGLDFLTVSTWAATPETYVKTHPNRTKEDFYKIRENLLYLNTHKKDKPCIKLYNVIFNMNYFEVEKMVEFAKETMSESLEFTLVDTMPNATDILVLNKEQLMELKKALDRIKCVLDEDNRVRDANILIFQFDQFLRRIYVVDDVKEAKYDRNIIDRMPCYIGWLFARIIPNGEVHSCLKAHRIPTGSLYKDRFLEIWNSQKQYHFRKKTLVCKKDDPFFRSIGNDSNIEEAGCYKSCDDIGRNTWMYDRMKAFTMPERLLLEGMAKTLKVIRNIKPVKNDYREYHEDPMFAGIFHGRKAFTGPEHVVIDPTNKCNLKCISCWLYSPLLTSDKPDPDFLKKELPKDVLVKLIDDLSSLGTKRIRFTGGGEPFMHKDLMEIIEYARRKKLLVALSTNFGMASKKDIKKLIDLGLEELCISIWGSNSQIYDKIHPGVSSSYFERLKENLLFLKETKKNGPRVTFANVIMNLNFEDFQDMYKFGLQYGADAVYFTLVDIFQKQTDKLLLNEEERKKLLNMAMEVKERNKDDSLHLEFFDGFLRRLSKSCEDFEKGEYDKFDVDKIPCYVGWFFARVLANGNIVPCCRGVKKVLGNINKKSFKDIWFSEKYNEFRARAKYLSKNDIYFQKIGCIKECDNLMHNEEMHSKIAS
ncbi:MAG: radical SAM protein [Candidatus Omnitrophica bacterium]|nr:radical SAM protein [Candidatus Omnitrophota bacterium]